MEKELAPNKVRNSYSGTAGRFVTSLTYACLAFVLVILFHQALLYCLSRYMGYETRLSFVKIDSRPYDNEMWSTNRVVLLYAFPPGILLLSAALLISRMLLYTVKKIDKWFVLSFWWSVCSILYVSTQVCLALIAYTFGRDELYQGIPVVINWFCLPMGATFVLSLFAVVANVLLGAFFSQLVMQFSPTRATVLNPKKQFAVIKTYFIYPLVAFFPLGAILSLPHSPFFFFVFLIVGLLWVPGLYVRVYTGEGAQLIIERNEVRDMKLRSFAAIVAFIVLVRIFFILVKFYEKP